MGLETAYYRRAATIGERVKAMEVENVSFVGHSLGGGLASTASGASGLSAQTFNAAGLSKSTLSGLGNAKPSLVNATCVVADILSRLQDHSPMRDAYGVRRAIGAAESAGSIPGARNVELHLTGAVHDALKKEQRDIEVKRRQHKCVWK